MTDTPFLALTTPLGTRLRRRGEVLLAVGQELLEFLFQSAGDRGRLVGAIGQNEPDEIENVPAAPFIPRHPQLLGLLGGGGSSGHTRSNARNCSMASARLH